MAAEGSILTIYVNEDIIHHDNDGHADGSNACVMSEHATSSTKTQKLGHRINEPTNGEKTNCFSVIFGAHPMG